MPERVSKLKKKLIENVVKPPGRGWLQIVKKSFGIIGRVAGVVLVAPIKVPAKLLSIAQYLAVVASMLKAADKSEHDE